MCAAREIINTLHVRVRFYTKRLHQDRWSRSMLGCNPILERIIWSINWSIIADASVDAATDSVLMLTRSVNRPLDISHFQNPVDARFAKENAENTFWLEAFDKAFSS